jgi:hypothetical protein
LCSTGARIGTFFRISDGLSAAARSAIDGTSRGSTPAVLEQAVAFAKSNGQLTICDCAEREWSIALWDAAARRVQPLCDEDAARLLNRDPLIRREWSRWSTMTRNQGSLIVLSRERIQRVLEGTDGIDEEDDVIGLA